MRLPKIERQEMRFLGPTEIAALTDVMARRYRALVVFDAYCGLRLGEPAGLRRGRLDLVRGQVRVSEIAIEVRGEILGVPKTRAGQRTVPIPRFVADRLASHLPEFCDRNPEALVFPGSDGGVLRTNGWRAPLATRRPGGRPGTASPSRPAHSAVSLWIAAGATPKQIATGAGHTSVSVVLDRYGHLFPGHEEGVLAGAWRIWAMWTSLTGSIPRGFAGGTQMTGTFGPRRSKKWALTCPFAVGDTGFEPVASAV